MGKTYLLPAIVLLLSTPLLFGQRYGKKPKQLFGASALVGLNLAQIDGDKSAGFNKPGVYAGLSSTLFLSRKTTIGIGFIYSQKGSKIERGGRFASFSRTYQESISADYIEIPVLIKAILDKKREIWYGEAGISFSRRVRLKIDEYVVDSSKQISFLAPVDDYKPLDISLVAGLGLKVAKDLYAGVRLTTALNNFYKNEDEAPAIQTDSIMVPDHLRNYFLTFMLSYQFF